MAIARNKIDGRKVSLPRLAEQLGVSHSHLYRVIKKQRVSGVLMRRYRQLVAEQGKEKEMA